MFSPISLPRRLLRTPEVKIQIEGAKDGVITLVDESRLPTTAFKEATNLQQFQDGRYGTRWGTGSYGSAMASTIDGAKEFRRSDGTTEIVAASNGTFYKSTNGGSWTALTGGTYTAGTHCRFLQILSRLYIVNGVDILQYYDGTNIVPYTAATSPGTPGSFSLAGVAASSSNTVYYKIVAVNDVGSTLPSSAGSTAVSKTRDNWVNGTDSVSFTWSAGSGSTIKRYEIYYSTDDIVYSYLDYVAAGVTTYKDTGVATPNPYIIPPTDNTTTGPKFSTIELSGNRIWGTGDPNNPYRVYGSGVGTTQGYFSAAYDGFYIDLEKGGREYPVAVKHYRDGKGAGQATILTSNPEGTGSIWQIDLLSQTVGTDTFIIPAATKIVGSVGTSGPDGVVSVLDTVMFPNKKGFYNLGSKPALLNVLSTDELSANIRPTWRGLTGSAMNGVVSYLYDAKVFISVPSGSSTNNQTMIFDTERRNWTPVAFTIGFKQFLEYNDTSGVNHLLGVPYTGNHLVEIGPNLRGDSGTAFNTSLVTGLIPCNPSDRYGWGLVKDVSFEFSQPTGTIVVELLGISKSGAVSSLGSRVVADSVTNSGMGTMAADTIKADSSTNAPTTFAQTSAIKTLRVNRTLRAFQVRITTSTLGAKYTLMNIRARINILETRDPSSYQT
jgi:hypothetical protein